MRLFEKQIVGDRSGPDERRSNDPSVINPGEFGVTVNRASLIDRGESSVYAGNPDWSGKQHVVKVFDVPFISEGYVTPELLREYQRITDQVRGILNVEQTVISDDEGVSVSLSVEPIELVGSLGSRSGPATTVSKFVPGLRLIDIFEPELPFHVSKPRPIAQDFTKLRLFHDELQDLLQATSQRLNRQLGVRCISIYALNIKPMRSGHVFDLRITDVCGIVTDIDPSVVASRPAMLG